MELRARISAVMDTDLSTVFRPLIEDSQRARQKVVEQTRAMGAGVQSAAQQAAERERAVFQATHELQLNMLRQRMQIEKTEVAQRGATERKSLALAQKTASDLAKIDRDLYKQREQLRSRDAEQQVKIQAASQLAAQRHQQKLQAIEKAAEVRGSRESSGRGGFVSSVASAGMRNFTSTVSAGMGLASQIARGAGVSFDLGGMVGKSVDLEKRATDLSNAGFMAGDKGIAGQRQDPRQIMADIKGAASATAQDFNKMAEGLQAFVGKTGDLELGRNVLGDMGKLARATGAEVNDMVNAAGDVASNLGNVENKGQAVNTIMRIIAGQGKLGAVEIKDLATQMAKLSASAPQFSGRFEDTMADMGALVQMTRQKGGAASAEQAATSLGSFTSTFSKGARNKEFAARGIKLDAADGKLRSAEDIIVDSLRATKGDRVGMGKLFMSEGARRVTRGFETTYNEASAAANKAAGGGEKGKKAGEEAGIAAVHQAFATLRNAAMSEQEVNDSFKKSMETAEAKAQLFQNQLQEVVNSLATRAMPAIEKWGPRVLAMAEAAASFVEKLASMEPGQLIMAAIAASIAQAALGEGIKTLMTTSLAGGIAGIAAVTIATAVVTIYRAKVEDDVEKVNKGAEVYDAVTRMREATQKLESAKAVTELSRQKVLEAKQEEEDSSNFKSRAGRAVHDAAVKKRMDAEREYKGNLEKERPLDADLGTEVARLRMLTDKHDEVAQTQNNTANSYGQTGAAGASGNGADMGGASGNISGAGPGTGDATRSDVHIATAIDGMRSVLDEMAYADKLRGANPQRVEIVNQPLIGVDPAGRTGPRGVK